MSAPQWETACLDWEDRIIAGQSIIPPPIFPEQAEHALSVLKELKIVDAAGSPRIGDACAPWIFDLVSSIFGAYDPVTGRRLIREWFVLIPKKNSKSTIAAAVMLTAQIINWRQSGEFTIIAPTVSIAGNSFSPAKDMVKHDEELDGMFHVQDHVKTITHRVTGARLKVLASDSNTVGGTKSIGLLVDELHLFGKVSNAGSMFREAIGGLASRPEGFVIWLTTQSDEPPEGVFKEKLQYARDVRDGKVIDKEFVPIIYEFPQRYIDKKLYLEDNNWKLVNPNAGLSVDEAFITREFEKSKNEGDASLRSFLAKHCNVEVGLALKSDNWAGAQFWAQNADAKITLDYIIENSDVICAGIDGGGLDDLLGIAVIGREKETGKWLSWAHAYAHPSVLERRKQDVSKFRDFEADGNLTIVESVGVDTELVSDIMAKINDSGLLYKIGVDQHGLGGIVDALESKGIEEDFIIGISQGWKLNGAIKTVERKLAANDMPHQGCRLMNWCVSNAKIVPVGNAIAITKQASGSAKIDPVMALLNAASLMQTNPEAMGGSFWDAE